MIDHRQTTDILVSSFKYVQYSTVQYSTVLQIKITKRQTTVVAGHFKS